MDENLIDLEILTVKDQAYRIKDGALTKRVEQLEQNAGAGGSGGGGTQGAQGPQGEKGDPGNDGADGKSAYEIWLDAGNQGTETDFLNAIKGAKGDKGDSGNDGANGTNGADGKSAYEIWLDAGNQGTETDFLNALKGAKGDKGNNGTNGVDGKSAYDLWLEDGNQGTQTDFLNAIKGAKGDKGNNGTNGSDGKSAYEIWLDAGNQGTETDFLNAIKGAKGDKGANGTNGANGKSAYQIWLDDGNQGSETDFLNAIKGAKGDKGNNGTNGADGKSAYQIWLDAGNQGTQADYLNAIKGAKGDKGDPGDGFDLDGLTEEQRNSLLTELRRLLSGNFVKQIPDLDAYTDAPDGEIVQYVGQTDAKYTRGFFYERVKQQQLAITAIDASGTPANVQQAVANLTPLTLVNDTKTYARYIIDPNTGIPYTFFSPGPNPGDPVYAGDGSGVYHITRVINTNDIFIDKDGETEIKDKNYLISLYTFQNQNGDSLLINTNRVDNALYLGQDEEWTTKTPWVYLPQSSLFYHYTDMSDENTELEFTFAYPSSWQLIHVSPSIQ